MDLLMESWRSFRCGFCMSDIHPLLPVADDHTFAGAGAKAGMLRMTRVPFPGWLKISTLPP